MTVPSRPVLVGGRRFDVVDDVVLRTEALVRCRVLDVMTGAPPRSLAVRSLSPFTWAHIARGGHLVVTGRADLALSNLATTAHDLEVEIAAAGLDRQVVTLHVAAGAAALPRVLGDLSLAQHVVAVAGVARRASFPFAPVAGAAVEADPPVALLRTALAFGHDAGTPVRQRSIGAALGTTSAVGAAVAGGRTVELAAMGGFAPGRVAAIGPLDRRELVVIDSIDLAASRMTLRAPLRRSVSAGTPIACHALGPVGAVSSLAAPSRPGDGVIVLTAPLAGQVVDTLDGDPAIRELRDMGVRTAADGRYRVDGVRGVATLRLTFAAGPLGAGPIELRLDPRRDPTTLDADLV